eukprot:sb/3477083/
MIKLRNHLLLYVLRLPYLMFIIFICFLFYLSSSTFKFFFQLILTQLLLIFYPSLSQLLAAILSFTYSLHRSNYSDTQFRTVPHIYVSHSLSHSLSLSLSPSPLIHFVSLPG